MCTWDHGKPENVSCSKSSTVVTHDRVPTLMLASNRMTCRHTGMQRLVQTQCKLIHAAYAAYVQFHGQYQLTGSELAKSGTHSTNI